MPNTAPNRFVSSNRSGARLVNGKSRSSVSNGESSENGVNSSRSNSSSNSSNEEADIGSDRGGSLCDDVTYNPNSNVNNVNSQTVAVQNQQNSCAVDLSANFFLNGDIFDEVDEQPSNEFARADDVFEQVDGHDDQEQVKSSDEEFTYSYGDVLSTANRLDEAAEKLEEKQVTVMSIGKEIASECCGGGGSGSSGGGGAAEVNVGNFKIHHEMLNLNIHRLPGKQTNKVYENRKKCLGFLFRIFV